MRIWKYAMASTILGSALVLGACGNSSEETSATESEETSSQTAGEDSAQVEGSVSGDGSSTVAPIMEGIVEEYAGAQPNVQVTVGVSGTGGGFEKFIQGETAFSNASRPIKEEEAAKLKEAGIDYTEFQLAFDGLTVVVSKDNDWVEDLTVEDLKKLWVEDGKTKKWSDINPEWPDEEVVFYSPGTDSGTFDYFNEVILEDEDLVSSATLSEDDNVLVQGIQADPNAIGFFGYAYYVANQDTLKAVKIGGIEPNNETIESGEYAPLSRPLFTYASNKALAEDPAAYDFMKYTLENAGEMAEAVGYVALPEADYEKGLADLEALKK
ncbi:phosphate-binding protein [Planococcus glaciei]|uniref:Phosphate-binding protein n=1 Tax=Planococcus glaciei TaxID=459472 RepID=A0A7H8QF11_9BACL|nr:PstS family phosphate ABC transporter substrate-binding protein [Planococcus glaciei]ETP67834.1 phosphate-binding protein [Planococcus glaciei CHR43]KOF11898.1 phosphate-binding protein [Planococcus glaciei]MBX0314963.1 PstS family phosphate ABC transporter substrate-binding protein [Planococcus glaciei]QKX51833.1 PstS family phosphate ABC transporter substrate-binding protein [Planococcus glaciei]